MKKCRSHENLYFVASINNTNIADKIAKQAGYTLKTLQDAFKRALTLEAGLQLAKGIHLGRSPQVMQVSASVSCHHDGLKGYVHQVNVRDSQARSNACLQVEDWATSKRIERLP